MHGGQAEMVLDLGIVDHEKKNDRSHYCSWCRIYSATSLIKEVFYLSFAKKCAIVCI